MTSPALLELEGLRQTFGALAAVSGVSLTVAPRERRAIIGPNGERTTRQRKRAASAAIAVT